MFKRCFVFFVVGLIFGCQQKPVSKMFFPKGKVTEKDIGECVKWIEGELAPVKRIISNYKIDSVIGSSGTIMAAGLMIKAMEDESTTENILNNYKFKSLNISSHRSYTSIIN